MDDGKMQADYLRFESLEAFVDWFKSQGDRLIFSLTKRNRSYTHNGWVKKIESPAQILTVTDTTLKMVTKVHKLISDEGIIFEDVKHCSEAVVDCMALKCVIQPLA